jgi:hypothetical protein
LLIQLALANLQAKNIMQHAASFIDAGEIEISFQMAGDYSQWTLR